MLIGVLLIPPSVAMVVPVRTMATFTSVSVEMGLREMRLLLTVLSPVLVGSTCHIHIRMLTQKNAAGTRGTYNKKWYSATLVIYIYIYVINNP